MRIVKLPVDYVRYLIEEKHVVYGEYEYWVFVKSHNRSGLHFGYLRMNIKTGDTEEVKVV